MSFVGAIKSVVKKLPFNITKNQQYDSQTKKVMLKVLNGNGVFLDVGCHKGEVLDWAIEFAPFTRHIAFEAIPSFAKDLTERYPKQTIHHVALSDYQGKTEFHHVTSNPAYSGINKREYVKEESIELIEVEVNTIDHLVDKNQSVSLIKIDVEGGEFQVLKGAINTIKRETPVIVFEHGLGASEFYENGPDLIWELIHEELGMEISLMKSYLAGGKIGFTKDEFRQQ